MANTKTTKKATKTKFSAEDKKAYAAEKRAEQLELLTAAVDALTSEAGWINYLNTASKFHKYSFNNRILIAIQQPKATQVAGAGTWYKQFDRTLIEGEKENPCFILAPMMIWLKDKAGRLMLDENGKKIIDRVWFKTVKVYDVSQTEGKAIPTAPELEPITGESHEEYLYRAEALWTSMGYTVEYDSLTGTKGSKRGSVNLKTREVSIDGTLKLNGQVRTHLHELAHAIGGIDYSDYTRQQAEVIVESAAYIAAQMVGLDTTGMSVPYITTWGADAEDPKAAMKIMKAFTKTIDTLAEAIVEGVS